MYIPANLLSKVHEVGVNAAIRMKSVHIDQVWSELIRTNYENLERLLSEAIHSNFNFAVLKNEPIDSKQFSTASPVQAVGVDGSQIYPHEKLFQYSYVCAVGYPTQGKPIYRSDFIDLSVLKSHSLIRKDLQKLLRISNGPTTFVDMWRAIIELDTALEASERYPGSVILMDGPLLPPKVPLGNNAVPNQKWVEWLVKLRDSHAMIAGIVSGPTSSLLASMMALAKANTVWEARHSKPAISDTDIMRFWLAIGERSAIFEHVNQRNEILAGNRVGVGFYFLRTSKDEILRVEIPQWIISDVKSIETLQSSILADAKFLGGYSYVLSAAHDAIAIPTAISNDLYDSAQKAYLENEGKIFLSGKRRMKMARMRS